jgi:hypothetical protein
VKAKGIEITLVHHETHPHGAPGEGSQLGVAFPLNLEIDAVSVDGPQSFRENPGIAFTSSVCNSTRRPPTSLVLRFNSSCFPAKIRGFVRTSAFVAPALIE